MVSGVVFVKAAVVFRAELQVTATFDGQFLVGGLVADEASVHILAILDLLDPASGSKVSQAFVHYFYFHFAEVGLQENTSLFFLGLTPSIRERKFSFRKISLGGGSNCVRGSRLH